MKIIFVDEGIDRVGGVERTVSTLANQLSLNNDVKVISEVKTSLNPYYSYTTQIKRFYLNDYTKSKAKKRNKKDLLYFICRTPEKAVEKLRMPQKIKTTISQFLTQADVIVFGRIHTALHFLRYFKKYELNAKVVVRDAMFLNYYSKHMQRKIKKYFSKYVNHFIVSSDESLEAYTRFFHGSSIKLKKIYNPLGIKPVCSYKYNSKTIISIGRMDKQKGYDALIDAFKFVYSKHPDWKLEIYGDGSYKKKIKQLIEKENLEKSVFLKPSTKNVVEVFNRSSIFVLASRYEGYANVLVEALACGIPSISYDWLMGVNEIIKDDVNGKIVSLENRRNYMHGKNDPEDIKKLADCINYLIENKEVCDKMVKNSISIQESRNPKKIMQEWQNIILKEKK